MPLIECSVSLLFLAASPTVNGLASGPRGEATRGRRPRRDARPRTSRVNRARRTRPEHDSIPWDPKGLVSKQLANEDATPLDLSTAPLKLVSESADNTNIADNLLDTPAHPYFRSMSLDELYPGLSSKFCEDDEFRIELRDSIRRDVFQDTPLYQGLSEKAQGMLLQPDSSLQGSWKSKKTPRTDQLLSDTFGENPPKGSELLDKIGALCGEKASTHWMDIYGVQDRTIKHSWHQDTGRESYTVLWGFPTESNYRGTGVFTHIVSLQQSHFAPEGHALNEPLLFQGEICEEYIVRPEFLPGKELLIYRDVDTLHSAPDVTYRASVMRFM